MGGAAALEMNIFFKRKVFYDLLYDFLESLEIVEIELLKIVEIDGNCFPSLGTLFSVYFQHYKLQVRSLIKIYVRAGFFQ